MKSIWKKKIYTINRYRLINFNSLDSLDNLDSLKFERKALKISDLSFKIVNRFIPLELNMKNINLNLSIYNGKFFYTIQLKDNLNLKNFKYGSLSFTRKMGLIHNKKKKDKKSKKKK